MGEAVEAPEGLGEAGSALWVDTVAVYELTAQERRLLAQACVTLDVIGVLDARVVSDGAVVEGSKGQPVLHPAIGEARQQRLALGRLLAQLALPDPDGGLVRTPEQVRASVAAQARWRAQSRRDGVA